MARRNPATAEIQETIATYRPPNEWVAAVLQYFYGIQYGVKEITRIFVDREETVRVWVKGSGDNIPLGDFQSFAKMLASIGNQVGLDQEGIRWMLGVAQEKTKMAGGRTISAPTGPKLIGGPKGRMQMPWETNSAYLDARNNSLADFLDPEFPIVEQFDVPEVQPGVIEASRPWIGGKDFNTLVLLRTEANSTHELIPHILSSDPGQSIEDGIGVIRGHVVDLWGNNYWWVEKKFPRLTQMPSEFMAQDLGNLKWEYSETPWVKTIIEYGLRWSEDEKLPGWIVFFRFSDGSWGWYRPAPEMILILRGVPPESAKAIVKSAAQYHGFEFSKIGNYLK